MLKKVCFPVIYRISETQNLWPGTRHFEHHLSLIQKMLFGQSLLFGIHVGKLLSFQSFPPFLRAVYNCQESRQRYPWIFHNFFLRCGLFCFLAIRFGTVSPIAMGGDEFSIAMAAFSCWEGHKTGFIATKIDYLSKLRSQNIIKLLSLRKIYNGEGG